MPRPVSSSIFTVTNIYHRHYFLDMKDFSLLDIDHPFKDPKLKNFWARKVRKKFPSQTVLPTQDLSRLVLCILS